MQIIIAAVQVAHSMPHVLHVPRWPLFVSPPAPFVTFLSVHLTCAIIHQALGLPLCTEAGTCFPCAAHLR